jgi:hypothetical protein
MCHPHTCPQPDIRRLVQTPVPLRILSTTVPAWCLLMDTPFCASHPIWTEATVLSTAMPVNPHSHFPNGDRCFSRRTRRWHPEASPRGRIPEPRGAGIMPSRLLRHVALLSPWRELANPMPPKWRGCRNASIPVRRPNSATLAPTNSFGATFVGDRSSSWRIRQTCPHRAPAMNRGIGAQNESECDLAPRL